MNAQHNKLMTDIQILISWLRCFDDDERDQHMANRCADTMEKMLAVVDAVQAFVDEADSEGLLIGCGENYPGEKEGKYGKGIRKALAALVLGRRTRND